MFTFLIGVVCTVLMLWALVKVKRAANKHIGGFKKATYRLYRWQFIRIWPVEDCLDEETWDANQGFWWLLINACLLIVFGATSLGVGAIAQHFFRAYLAHTLGIVVQ